MHTARRCFSPGLVLALAPPTGSRSGGHDARTALIDCPECGRSVSSSAVACSDCAYPVGKAASGRGGWNGWRIAGTALIVLGSSWAFIYFASTLGWTNYQTDNVQLIIGVIVAAVGVAFWIGTYREPIGNEPAEESGPFVGKEWVLGKDWDKQGEVQVVRCLDCNWDVYFPSGMKRHGDHRIELPPSDPSGVWTDPSVGGD